MHGHRGGDGLYWIGLSRLELYYLVFLFEFADIDFFTDRVGCWVNRVMKLLKRLYEQEQWFEEQTCE